MEKFVCSNVECLDKCNLYLWRARLVLFLAYFLIYVVLIFYTESLLTLFGQNPEVSIIASKYVVAYFPALVLAGYIDCQRKFLNIIDQS